MSLPRALTAAPGFAAVALLALTPSAALARAADGTISTTAVVQSPTDIAFSGAGTLLVADPNNHVVRFRQPPSGGGRQGIAAGTGNEADGCPNTSGNDDLGTPRGVEFDDGRLFVIDQSTNCIRFIHADGSFERIGGNADGQPGLAGDHGPATSARLREPSDIAVAQDGSIYIADTGNHRIRRVTPQGVMLTAAGTTEGFSGDGGPAESAQLSSPRDLAVQPDGGLLVADTGNHRIRRIAPDGTITTVAGGTGIGPGGDGDPARAAQLSAPAGVLPLPHGGFLIADTANNRVRRVTPLGAIFTVVGSTPGSAGDGGLARDAQLTAPTGLAARADGGFAVADTGNSRVREVTDVGAVPGAVDGRSFNVAPVSGDVKVAPLGANGALPLQEDDLVPLGSAVDARDGQLTVTVERAGDLLQPALVYAGSFTPTKAPNDVTDLNLIDPLVCPPPARAGIARTASISRTATIARKGKKKKRRKKGKTQRRLWVKGKGGRYRTKGRYVGALERGTQWLTEESCTSATVTVRRGSVRVRNRVTGKSHVVHAGESYTIFV
jgi:hypothetical protein